MKTKSILTFFILLAILVCAALLRVPGVFWGDTGIKEGSFAKLHPDEKTHVTIAESFLDQNKKSDKDYIMGFGQQIASIGYVVKMCTGKAQSKEDLYHFGRWLSVFYSLATVLLLFFIIKILSQNRTTALLASLFLSLCSLAINSSHFAVADAATSFWIMAACFACFIWIECPSKCAFLAAFTFGAVAVSVKISISVVGPLIAIIYLSKKKLVHSLWGMVIFILTLVIATGFSLGIEEMQGIYEDIFYGNMCVIPHHTFLETLVSTVISIFPAFSLPVVLLSGFGLSYITKNSRLNWSSWLCFGLPALIHLLMLLLSDVPFERHLLPFAPLVCGLAAFAWQKILQSEDIVKNIAWSGPLFAYLLFFAIDGEMPFWQENRAQAKKWVEYFVEPGSSVYLSPNVKFSLPAKKFDIHKSRLKKNQPITEIDLLVLHEAHTYRYEMSRLSPLRKPDKDNVYNSSPFFLNYFDQLTRGELPFSLVKHLPSFGNWAPERAIYKKYWGTFQSFVGDIWIYQLKRDI